MSEKELKVRIQHKHDVEANWLKAINFIPLASEIIIYDQDENYDYPRIKIGDNKTNVNALPFVTKDYAKISDIPTKPADIGAQPAGNYLTSIPNEYVTEDELNSKGYLTNYTETDPTVPAWAKASTKPTYNKSEVGLSNVDNIQQYSANNPPVVVRTSAPSDTNLLWIDPNENTLAYIPVKGVDFWTEADQESIVQQVITALSTPVFGRVDTDNNIILTGALADGIYTLKYEDANGNVAIIGTLNHSNVPEPTYTNLIPLSVNADGTLYNGGQGWKTGARLNSSGAESTSSATDVEVTGFIPVKAGDVIYLKNVTLNIASAKAGQSYFWLYDSNFTKLTDRYKLFSQYDGQYGISSDITNKYVATDTGDENGNITMIKIHDSARITHTDNGNTKGNINDAAYFRISCEGISADSIITVNEPIVQAVNYG